MNNIIKHTVKPQGFANSAPKKVMKVEKSPLLMSSQESSLAEETKTETSVDPETKAEPTSRETKRTEFAALEKSRRLQAEAKSKLKKAEELAAAYESKDIDRIAKANGMSTTDYIRWVNTSALKIPTKADLSPAEQVALNAKNWQDNLTEEVKALREEASNNKKWTYVNKNILPHLIKDEAKFEFIHDKGVDQVCSDIYDFMNQHFLETGGKNGGEELDPVELLESLEEQYMEEWKETQAKASKFKKLQAKIEVADISSDKPIKTIGPGKSVPHPAKTEADILNSVLANDDENALARSAPSNLTTGPSRGSSGSKLLSANGSLSGITPKGSKFSREARLAALSKSRE